VSERYSNCSASPKSFERQAASFARAADDRFREENRSEIIIFWSDDDDAFVADVPELPGCMAHGSSHSDALANAEEAVRLWLETAQELGRPIPQPKGRRLVYA